MQDNGEFCLKSKCEECDWYRLTREQQDEVEREQERLREEAARLIDEKLFQIRRIIECSDRIKSIDARIDEIGRGKELPFCWDK